MPSQSKSTRKPGPKAQHPQKQTSRWFHLGRAAGYLALAALASPVSQLTLAPVYGSIPSSQFHQRSLSAIALLAFVWKGTVQGRLWLNLERLLPVIAFWIPTIQFFLFSFSSKLGPTAGPLLTELLTLLPLLFVTFFSGAGLVEKAGLTSSGHAIKDALPVVGSYMGFSLLQKLFYATLPHYIGTASAFTRTGLQLLIACAFSALSPSWLIFLALPSIFHTFLTNPHFVADTTTAALNKTLAPHQFTLLERQESLTGYISVLEGQNDAFRVMRCDHSLLGGEWLVSPDRAEQGQKEPESIYSVFNMLEAVRLIEVPDKREDAESSALVIGLGIGTSPSAFIKLGINTTIVEIDPVVHYFATKYFGLPSNHTAAIENAIPFVRNTALDHPSSYDYIIHDVFTGGAEPAALFTLEFLEGLRSLLRENGAIAINYAGDLELPSAKMVLNTIHTVFPNCRIYRDSPPDPDGETFINMILFCVKSEDSKLTFRKPELADHGDSLGRQRYIPPNPEWEIAIDLTSDEARSAGVLRRGQEAELERHQIGSALAHWKIMRNVLPDIVWETW
ncbi:spermine/spermidine synthase [Eremomyces bilateralis CBS 781.70]|uniref:Spermine/spermidine synthase n=1 Tax=Eremomyces bilateralis CBS 781.70 TaxID=1392243 RepID=A0A6G1GF31_9PEZI|nr:spermine/spermidine synthase [Eremomyces bilateralis CBS 781.70]KAF1816687.1 spermine/spermidine synthase [Eremomyces bilateralis CBS 781.70]